MINLKTGPKIHLIFNCRQERGITFFLEYFISFSVPSFSVFKFFICITLAYYTAFKYNLRTENIASLQLTLIEVTPKAHLKTGPKFMLC